MVPDCALGWNKNITGNFCETTTRIKTTGIETKKPHSLLVVGEIGELRRV